MKNFGASDLLQEHRWILKLIVFLTVITGIVYTIGRTPPPFVFFGLIVVNTILAYLTLTISHDRMDPKQAELFGPDFKRKTFCAGCMIGVGLAWGCLIGFGAFMSVSGDSLFSEDNSRALFVFMFVHNVLIGMGIYSLCRFLLYVYRYAPKMKVGLWDRSSSELNGLLQATRWITICVAAISTIAITSVLPYFSTFPVDAYVLVFSLFSLAFIGFVFIFPLVPINQTLQNTKRDRLDQLGKLITAEYDLQICRLRKGCTDYDLQKYNELAAVYANIQSIPSLFYPWNTQMLKSVLTGVWILILAVWPWMLENILDKLAG